MEHAGIGQGLEERPWQLASRVDIVGAGPDQWSELPGSFEGR
jgi:hypothetical protein